MCEDPLEPQNRQEFKSWNAAYKANVAEVGLYRALTGESPTTVDIDTGKTRCVSQCRIVLVPLC